MTSDEHSRDLGQADMNSEQFALSCFGLSEAARSLELQQTELNRLRERVITQLGLSTGLATFVLSTLFGRQPSKGAVFWSWSVVMTALFVLSGYTTFNVWKPVQDWKIKIGAGFIVDYYAAKPISHEAMSALASFYDGARSSNERKLSSVRSSFRHATVWQGVLVLACVAGLWLMG